MRYLKEIKETDDSLKIICLLASVDYEILKNATVKGADNIIRCLSFLSNAPKFDGVTDHIGPYKLPINHKGQFDIQFESLGQFEDMRGIVKSIPQGNAIELLEAYPKFCALYLQKIRDGEYNYGNAMEMVNEVRSYPLSDILIAGSFFLLSSTNSPIGTRTSSHQQKKTRKRRKQDGRNSSKRSARTRK
jgi:hypothetical protein